VIEVAIDLAGYPVVLADTAGLRDSDDAIEQEGLRRALARAESAELRLFVFDAACPEDAAGAGQWPGSDTLLVANKIDLLEAPPPAAAYGGASVSAERSVIPISALSGEGLAQLIEKLAERVTDRYDSAAPVITRARHREALESAAAALSRSLAAELPELRAEDLRLALRGLGRITGRVDVEDLLDVIFADFCLGK
jgi:tRNA modification GTPase